MKIKSEGFEDLFVVGNEKHKLLLKNLRETIEILNLMQIDELWASGIILAFEASGYRIVKDDALFFRHYNSVLPIRTQCPDSCPDRTVAEHLFRIRAATMQESETKWIYESPDNGKTVFRRPFGNYETPRELVTPSYDKTKESIIR